MSMQEGTNVSKGRDGWEAETVRLLPGGRALIVRTSKAGRGGVDSSAKVVMPTEHGFSWIPFQDFGEQLRKAPGARCTERTVTEEHTRALVDIEAIAARAIAHYPKGAEESAEN